MPSKNLICELVDYCALTYINVYGNMRVIIEFRIYILEASMCVRNTQERVKESEIHQIK